MAIQFDCPYCTASIRVPDGAAGKKGTCPQCQTKLVVPVPKGMPSPPVAAPVAIQSPANMAPPGPFVPPVMPSARPHAQVPVAPTQPMMFDPRFVPQAQVPNEPPVDEPSPATLARRRRQAKKQRMMRTVGAIAVVIVIAIIGYVIYASRPKANPLSGELTGSRVTNGKLDSFTVFRDEITLEDELVETALTQLTKRPVRLKSERMQWMFRGAKDGLQISLVPGSSADLVGVPIKGHKALATWSSKDGAKLADKNRSDVSKAATRFVQSWIEADARGDKKPDFGKFQEELGMASLAMGLGSEVVAVVDGVAHRCVAEQQGQLWFLLPSGTTRFSLEGREHGKGNFVFPGKYRVRISEESDLAPKRTKKSDSGDDDAEMPESNKDAFGKPALNDPAAMSKETKE